jgi:O-antigen/teichoic acid export membrane protein
VSLRREATRGVKWTGAASFAISGLQFARLVVLARLLSPEDFGLMAMITVVMAFAGTFADSGLSNAIIYRQEASSDQISSLYWTSWIVGLIIFGLIIAVTPLVAVYYRDLRIHSLLPWVALSFLIGPVGQQFKVLLQRDLRFREIAIVEVAAALLGTVVSVALALYGCGIYALIFGQLLAGITESLLLAIIGWRDWAPRLHYRLGDLKNFAGFGAFQIGERCANVFAANIDYLLIGRVLGPAALGPYTLAYQLIVAPVTRINPILTRVAFPIFAKKQSDVVSLRAGYLEISKFLAFVTCPLLVGVAAGAPILVPALLGTRWGDTIQLIEILAGVGIFRTLANPLGSILFAKGRADIGFWLNVYVALEYLIVFLIFVRSGTTAIATAHLIMVSVNFIFCQMLINHMLELSWRAYLRAIASFTISALVMGVIVRFTCLLIKPMAGVGPLSAAVILSVGASVYCLCAVILERSYVRNIIGLIGSRQTSNA